MYAWRPRSGRKTRHTAERCDECGFLCPRETGSEVGVVDLDLVAVGLVAPNDHVGVLAVRFEWEPLLGDDLAAALFVNDDHPRAGVHAGHDLSLAGHKITGKVVILFVSQAAD